MRALLHSLRFRIVCVTTLVVVVMASLLVANSVRLMDQTLVMRANTRLAELRMLLSSSIPDPLRRGDRFALKQMLARLQSGDGLEYLAVLDDRAQVIEVAGQISDLSTLRHYEDFSQLPKSADRFDGLQEVDVEGALPVRVLFGMSTEYIRQARSRLLWQGTAIAGLASLVAVMLSSVLAFWLTRSLHRLQEGVSALESGAASIKLPVTSSDEVGTLTRAFNRMAQTLGERMEALKKSESRFHAVADYTYGVEAWFTPQGRLIWINRSVERVTGYTPLECLLSKSLVDMLVFEKDRKHAQSIAAKAVRGTTGENVEIRFRRKDNKIVWISINWQPIYDAGGEFLGLRVSADEIQSRKEAELKLLDTVVELRRAQALKEYYLNHGHEERARLEALLNVISVSILFVDAGHRVLYSNKPFRAMWGFAEDENLTGMRDTLMLDRCAGLCVEEEACRKRLAEILAQREPTGPFEIELKDGRIISEISALVPGAQSGKYIGRVWIYEDVTDEKRSEDQLIRLAERDALTNLFNRRRFHEELERVLADVSRRGSQAGLLAIDLDGFKPINDEFGHQSGDVVLSSLAREVGQVIRRNEMFFRVGGDEFAILVPDADEEEMIGLARRVGAKVSALRFQFSGQEATLTASLGIALYPKHAASAEEIVARADHAMYQAKVSGKNRWAVYTGAALH